MIFFAGGRNEVAVWKTGMRSKGTGEWQKRYIAAGEVRVVRRSM